MLKKPLAVLAIIPIRVYQLAISPWLPVSCRFQPTCSEYAITAIKEHGMWRGAWLAARRLGRCHPWGGSGFDPVPHGKACGQKTCSHKHAAIKAEHYPENTRAS